MYQGRYGIWGEDPNNAPDIVGYGMNLAKNFSDLQNTNLKNQTLGIQNQWLPQLDALKAQSSQIKNQYYPQDEAVKLANALTLTNRQNLQQSRFGDPMYMLTKWLNSQAAPVRTAFAQQNPELYAQINNRQFNNVLNPSANQPAFGRDSNSQAYQVLTPFIREGNQPPAYGQQTDPTQAPGYFYSSKSLGQPLATANQSVPSTSYGQPSNGSTVQPSTVQPNNQSSGIGAPQSSTSTTQPKQYFTGAQVKEATDNALSKQLDTASTINRQAAYGRIQKPIEQLIPNIEALAKYQGLLGKTDLGFDAIKSKFNITSDDYAKYQNALQTIDAIKGDLGPLMGKQATDQAVKDMAKLLDFSGNPKIALGKFYQLMDTIQKTGDVNAIPIGQQKAHPEIINKINASPPYGWAKPPQRWMVGGQIYSDGKGNFYTRDEFNKMLQQARSAK